MMAKKRAPLVAELVAAHESGIAIRLSNDAYTSEVGRMWNCWCATKDGVSVEVQDMEPHLALARAMDALTLARKVAT
jgi:hypothetical protein